LLTVRVYVTGMTVKVAVTPLAAFIVTTHWPVPAHAPLQPVNVEPAEAVASSVTSAPDARLALQVAPQSMVPAGTLATVPVPVPALLTVRVYVTGIVWPAKLVGDRSAMLPSRLREWVPSVGIAP
jgi:hypothetical protein